MQGHAMMQFNETILIVDDEDSVRRTFNDWLANAGLDCKILTARDAESALQIANQQTIDLAILDWALGAGDDGLQLLQDLYAFNPAVIAIMVTGYANQATPLDAMRMGVRDYLDKNQDLNRETFLNAVRRQLALIRPAKRERLLHDSLVGFREAVQKILPLVQSAAALQDPVPLPEAVVSLFRFLLHSTGAQDGVFLVRHFSVPSPLPLSPGGRGARGEGNPSESCQVYDVDGKRMQTTLAAFARSVAATAISMQEPCVMSDLQSLADSGTFELQPFERGRSTILAAPLEVGDGVQAVLELFDKPEPFSEEDRRLVAAAAQFGAEMFRQALGGRHNQHMLIDALQAALGASDSVTSSLAGNASARMEEPPSEAVLAELRQNLEIRGGDDDTEDTLRLAEAIRVLSLKHGPAAVKHCIRLVESLQEMLDEVTAIV